MDFADKIKQINDLQEEIDHMISMLNLSLLESIQAENKKRNAYNL